MTASGSYHLQAAHSDVGAEIERLAAQARLGWDKEARTLAWFGLQDGMSVLEVGSGPGFITAQLLALLPHSHITCLEIDPSLITKAQHYLHDKGGERVRFVEGSVMATALADNQFDVAYARFLFQHLPDPLGAAQEIRRLLKPAGKLIIHDIDDEIFGLFEPPLPVLALVIEKFGEAQAARGGNRRIGRQLWSILAAAGFSSLDLELLASHSGTVGVAPFLEQLAPDRLQPLVEKKLLSAEELDQFRYAHTTFADSPEPYTLWLSLMVCGEKLKHI
jgi:ubiquinone/menaquinone biosynthesis C-methylase UbiE